ncbi:hypothetical protein [Fischerella sp. PCC 9605]|uniref:hypothetical protein n=1 Tax=Fischerella sp. PCC 9605 TaxID=1173024 RepID=UPI000478CEB2|nr:hypothetical protein [Fischerella sp. PCC 9605]
MSLRNEPLAWQLEANETYLPVYYKGEIAGFFKQEFTDEVLKFLNEEELLQKALQKACLDLIKNSGGDPKQVKDLIKKYIKMSERPKYGKRAIAALLNERQKELDLDNQEFAKFCDTFKLSPTELHNIYSGEAVEDSLLAPLSRILGISKERLLEVRDGSEEESELYIFP